MIQSIQVESPQGRSHLVTKVASKYLKKYHHDFKKLAVMSKNDELSSRDQHVEKHSKKKKK